MEYDIFSRCGPVKRQGVNAVRRCFKHALLFSNFTIVHGEIKRALLTCCCARQAFMSHLITEKPFFDWAEVWEESGQTMRAGRLSPIIQCEGNKDVVWNPSRGAGLPHFPAAYRPVNYSKASEDAGFVTPQIRLCSRPGEDKSQLRRDRYISAPFETKNRFQTSEIQLWSCKSGNETLQEWWYSDLLGSKTL